MTDNLVPQVNPEYSPKELQDQVSALQEQVEAQRLALEALSERLPDSNIISPSFLKRAFTVWGHYIVAGLIIAIPFILLGVFFALAAMLFSAQVGPPLN